MSMSPETKKMTIGWGVVISLIGLCIAILSGFGGGMRAVGKVEARVVSVEHRVDRHETELNASGNAHAALKVGVAGEISALQTDVKYIVKAVDAIQLELRQAR
jgi:hypothetical protein